MASADRPRPTSSWARANSAACRSRKLSLFSKFARAASAADRSPLRSAAAARSQSLALTVDDWIGAAAIGGSAALGVRFEGRSSEGAGASSAATGNDSARDGCSATVAPRAGRIGRGLAFAASTSALSMGGVLRTPGVGMSVAAEATPTPITIPADGRFWVSPMLAQSTYAKNAGLCRPKTQRVSRPRLPSLLTHQAPESGRVDYLRRQHRNRQRESRARGNAAQPRSLWMIAPEVLLSLPRARRAAARGDRRAAGATVSSPADTLRAEPVNPNARESALAPAPEVANASKVAPPSAHATATHTQAPAARTGRPNHDSRARADIALQSWGSQAAFGGTFGLEQATGIWTYAFLAGGARPLEQPSLSDVSEWTAAGELGWQRDELLGLRISARLGLSLLILNPESGVAASSGTLKSAGFLELDFSRPIWLGRFELLPALACAHSVPSARSPSKAKLSFRCRGRRRRLFSVSVPYQRIN